MLTAPFRTKSCFLLLHMPLLSLLLSVLYPQPLVPPSWYLMIPYTLTLLSHSLSPFTCFQSWSFSGPLYCIIFIQFIITHTHSKLCLIWTNQLACYCSESSSIIIHLRIPLFNVTSVHPGPSRTSPNWLATPSSHPLLKPLFPHVCYHFLSILAILLDCLTQKLMALHSLKTMGTTHPITMSHLISTAIRP